MGGLFYYYRIIKRMLFTPHKKKTDSKESVFWVKDGARTRDTRNHNPMLCQLSYNHHKRLFSKTVQRYNIFSIWQ